MSLLFFIVAYRQLLLIKLICLGGLWPSEVGSNFEFARSPTSDITGLIVAD
jgi:hypothetical protein